MMTMSSFVVMIDCIFHEKRSGKTGTRSLYYVIMKQNHQAINVCVGITCWFFIFFRTYLAVVVLYDRSHNAINQLKEKCREYNIPLCVAFVDYEKAFDSVQTQAILTSLQEQ